MGYMYSLEDEAEGDCICPYCGSALENVDFNSLVFMCPECGEYIEFARDNTPLMTNVRLKEEQ